jgi:hypothetical protein
MPYESYIEDMEIMRVNYNRMVRSAGGGWGGVPTYLRDPDGGLVRDEAGKIKSVHEHPGPMPLDLKAYVVAREYDADKHTFGKIIPELVKHKDKLHPFMRRYLLERLRTSENEHRRLAKRFGAIADQFETEEQPQSVSRDIGRHQVKTHTRRWEIGGETVGDLVGERNDVPR